MTHACDRALSASGSRMSERRRAQRPPGLMRQPAPGPGQDQDGILLLKKDAPKYARKLKAIGVGPREAFNSYLELINQKEIRCRTNPFAQIRTIF